MNTSQEKGFKSLKATTENDFNEQPTTGKTFLIFSVTLRV